MAHILAVVNQKGGVGKSTTAQTIGNWLSQRGDPVLFVDLDPQGNLTYALSADASEATSGAFQMLVNQEPASTAITKTAQGDLIASNPELVQLDQLLAGKHGRERRLRDALTSVDSAYRYIILDTPPALGSAVVNALTAAGTVVVPTQADIFSLQGLGQLSGTISTVQQYSNPDLTIAGILITRYNRRTLLSKQITEMLDNTAAQLHTKVFSSRIREAVAIKEAQALRTNVVTYAKGSRVAGDIESFMHELLEER